MLFEVKAFKHFEMLNLQKLINDPIHKHFTVLEPSLKIIDTPEFQRLRYLKQLGLCYYVFPGASHNRFEHSLGVSYLAGELLTKLRLRQPEIEVTDRDFMCVTLAGLCHDLGHGPFSHSFETWILQHIPTFSHEEQSCKLLELCIDSNALDFEQEDINFISDLIKPQKRKSFLYDIVSNPKNSIDVDKFDYILRDCYNLGISSNIDFSRFSSYSRVIDDEICYHEKESFSVYELFHTRYSLHKRVYKHNVVCAIELMISDILNLSSQALNLIEKVENIEDYVYFTDSILETISASGSASLTNSKTPDLEKARQLCIRLKKRDLYTCVGEHLGQYPKVTVQDFAHNELKPEDCVIEEHTLNYAFKNLNPVDHVKFYSTDAPNTSFTISKTDVSLLAPTQFSESYLRLYVKDKKKISVAKQAFDSWIKTFK